MLGRGYSQESVKPAILLRLRQYCPDSSAFHILYVEKLNNNSDVKYFLCCGFFIFHPSLVLLSFFMMCICVCGNCSPIHTFHSCSQLPLILRLIFLLICLFGCNVFINAVVIAFTYAAPDVISANLLGMTWAVASVTILAVPVLSPSNGCIPKPTVNVKVIDQNEWDAFGGDGKLGYKCKK